MAEKKTIELDIQSNLGSLRSQLRAAQQEVAAMADQFGVTSEQAREAAKRAAELKDRIEDAKQLTDAFHPEAKFNAFAGSLGGVASGFEAAQGAMAVFGFESENVQEALLRVQSAMALAQGVNGLLEAGDAFKRLQSKVKDVFEAMSASGKAFAVTGIGLLITGIGMLIANWDELKASIGGTNATQAAFNDTLEDYKKGASDAIEATSKVGASFKLAKEGVISKKEALDNYNETLGNTFGRAKNLDEAESLYTAKTQAYIKSTALRAQAQALFAKAAEAAAKGTTADLEDQTTFWDKLYAGSVTNLMNIDAGYKNISASQEKRVKETKINAKRTQTELTNLATQMLKDAELIESKNNLNVKSTLNASSQINNSNKTSRQEDLDNLLKYNQEASDIFKSEYEIQERNIKEKYDKQIELAKKYKQDITNLEKAKNKELQDLQDKQVDLTRLGDEKVAALQVKKLDHTLEFQEQEKKGLAGVQEVKERIAKRDEELAEKEKERNAMRVQSVKDSLSMISDITTLFTGKSKKQQEKAFKIQKSVNIANAVIDTYKAADTALASAPPPFNFIAMGAVITAGLVNVKKIADSKFEGGNVPSDSGGNNAPSSTGASIMSPSFNVVGNSGFNQLAQLQQQPMKAYVVSGDVTTAQALDRNRIENATLVQ